MGTSWVKVNSSIFDWLSGQIDFNLLSTKDITLYEKWSEGSKVPTYKQLEDFSKKTIIPFGYFFLEEAPSEDIELLKYRTISSKTNIKPSRSLVDKIFEMYSIQDWMREYRLDNDYSSIALVDSVDTDNSYDYIAQKIRNYLDLNKDWFIDSDGPATSFKLIREKLESVGIITMVNGVVRCNNKKPLSVNEFRAFALCDDIAPLIFINGRDSKGAMLFSLIHELTHLLFGNDDLFNLADKSINNVKFQLTEKLCNQVASEILAPNDLFIEKWKISKKKLYKERIYELGRYFKCGLCTLARLALDNGFITNNEYDIFVEELIYWFKNRKTTNGGDYYRTMGYRIDKNVLTSLSESLFVGDISYKDIYYLTNMKKDPFNNLLESLNII